MRDGTAVGSGRVAVVTGGGRGLGRAMVLGLAQAGIRVVATASREAAELEAVATQVGKGLVLPLMADATRPDVCEGVVAAALRHFGRIDILVNNAGRGMRYVSEDFLTRPTKFWETDPDVWRLVIDTNVNGPFMMARAVAPVLRATGWGRIINVSMNRETMRRAGFSPYGPSKAAIESETIIWAQDLAGSGVTVNALLPGGAADTGMIPARFPADARSKLLDAAIVVPPLLWLASEASDGVTGKRINALLWDESKGPQAAMDGAGWDVSSRD